MENGQVVAKGASGYARAPWEMINPAVAMTTTKPMLLASVSKLLTRVGLARLWELKRGTPQAFEYGQPAATHLRTLVPGLHPSFETVTIQNLAEHKSGLTNDSGDLEGMRAVLSQPLSRPSGSSFYYLNGNYYLLATIIEEIAGQRYAEFMRSNVFLPLGMLQTGDRAVEAAFTLFYGPASSRLRGAFLEVTGTQIAGAGGWWSTAEDLAKLMYSLRYSTLLTPATSDREGFNPGVWAYDGGIVWMWNGTHGRLTTRVCRRSDTLDDVLLINSDKGPAGALLEVAFQLPQPGWRCEVRQDGDALKCSFLAHAGYSYTLLRADSLPGGAWSEGPTVAGSNAVHNFEVPLSASRQFLRVRRN
jgi:CubicO group peptidase (beta-lactamase class C family)